MTAIRTNPGLRAAGTPPEQRGTPRDGVRLMLLDRRERRISHHIFTEVVSLLQPGDTLVINTSMTIAASIGATSGDGTPYRVHLSAPQGEDLWLVEIREPSGIGTRPAPDTAAETLALSGGGTIELLARHPRAPRLWLGLFRGVPDLARYLSRHGSPIRYQHTEGEWPLSDYQNVYAVQPGSVEMPSAGRPLTTRLITDLAAHGVTVLPVILHSGIASYESGEVPAEERYQVPEPTAQAINVLRAGGGRLVAVGTTVVRALESAADRLGRLHPTRGITDLVITPERGITVVDGLITGWHDEGSTHRLLLEALAGGDLVDLAYAEASTRGYLTHEFGDSLIVL